LTHFSRATRVSAIDDKVTADQDSAVPDLVAKKVKKLIFAPMHIMCVLELISVTFQIYVFFGWKGKTKN
jgi:hypothetical protein